jgi:hypothetical protein
MMEPETLRKIKKHTLIVAFLALYAASRHVVDKHMTFNATVVYGFDATPSPTLLSKFESDSIKSLLKQVKQAVLSQLFLAEPSLPTAPIPMSLNFVSTLSWNNNTDLAFTLSLSCNGTAFDKCQAFYETTFKNLLQPTLYLMMRPLVAIDEIFRLFISLISFCALYRALQCYATYYIIRYHLWDEPLFMKQEQRPRREERQEAAASAPTVLFDSDAPLTQDQIKAGLIQWALPYGDLVTLSRGLLVSLGDMLPVHESKYNGHQHFFAMRNVIDLLIILLRNAADAGDEDAARLAVSAIFRKIKFFLHPDRLPRDLTPEEQFLASMLWDILADSEATWKGDMPPDAPKSWVRRSTNTSDSQ